MTEPTQPRPPWQVPGWAIWSAIALILLAIFVGPSWLALVGLPVLLADLVQRFRRGHWIVQNAPYEEER